MAKHHVDDETLNHRLLMRIALFGYSHFTRHCTSALQQLGHRIELFCPIEDETFLIHYGLARISHEEEGRSGLKC